MRAFWRLAIQYVGFRILVALVFNVIVVGLVLGGSVGRAKPGGLDDPGFPDAVIPLASGLAGLVGAIVTVWLAGRFLDRRPFSDFGFHLGAGWWLDLFFGMALGALLITAVFLVQLGMGWVEVTGTFETFETGSPFAPSVLLPVLMFVCVGFYEERSSGATS